MSTRVSAYISPALTYTTFPESTDECISVYNNLPGKHTSSLGTEQKMSNLREPHSKKKTKTVGSFPETKPWEIEEFKRRCFDEESIADYAGSVRLSKAKYREIDDDVLVCVYHLKEQYIESLTGDLSMAIPLAATASTPVVSKYPQLSVFFTGLSNNSPKLATWITRLYKPELTIGEQDTQSDVFISPSDIKSIEDMKTFLKECGMPENATTTVTGFASEGLSFHTGLKGFITGVTFIVSWFSPTIADPAGAVKQDLGKW